MKKVSEHQLEELRRIIEHNDLFEYAEKLKHSTENMEEILERRKLARKIVGRFRAFLIAQGVL